MNNKDLSKLKNGIYCVSWKNGSHSFASLGTTIDGTRWIAPTNWVKPAIAITSVLQLIKEMEIIPLFPIYNQDGVLGVCLDDHNGSKRKDYENKVEKQNEVNGVWK